MAMVPGVGVRLRGVCHETTRDCGTPAHPRLCPAGRAGPGPQSLLRAGRWDPGGLDHGRQRPDLGKRPGRGRGALRDRHRHRRGQHLLAVDGAALGRGAVVPRLVRGPVPDCRRRHGGDRPRVLQSGHRLPPAGMDSLQRRVRLPGQPRPGSVLAAFRPVARGWNHRLRRGGADHGAGGSRARRRRRGTGRGRDHRRQRLRVHGAPGRTGVEPQPAPGPGALRLQQQPLGLRGGQRGGLPAPHRQSGADGGSGRGDGGLVQWWPASGRGQPRRAGLAVGRAVGRAWDAGGRGAGGAPAGR
jgi:hypothetical protein